MNPEIKKRWVEALRSGKYEQGRGRLRTKDNTYCCLGVLCDLYSQEFNIPWTNNPYSGPVEGNGNWGFMGSNGGLPEKVCEWSGLDSNPALIPFINYDLIDALGDVWPGPWTLPQINDNEPVKVGFDVIADLIEAQL